ncbi:MAG: Maf family nucleotide pyrophosphatase [Waddliaceae bacterium]
MTFKLILGSQSPRRVEILNFFSIPFTQVHSNFDEESIPYNGDPVIYAKKLAEEKAYAIKSDAKTAILTADTIVEKNGKIYGKPVDLPQAIQFLKELQGTHHRVITALSLRMGEKIWTDHGETKVYFHPLELDRIQSYLDAIEWHDKAGGYAIQQGGGVIVQKIEGCYYNVMGLPVNALSRLLKELNIDLLKCIK